MLAFKDCKTWCFIVLIYTSGSVLGHLQSLILSAYAYSRSSGKYDNYSYTEAISLVHELIRQRANRKSSSEHIRRPAN